jgi:uncharacterized membrane protein (DUF4010 family)
MFEQFLTDPSVPGFATALGVGLLIGAERERRKGKGPARAPAGIRTFAIVALLGAVTARVGDGLLVAVLLAGVTGFVWQAYRRQRSADPGITSETALILTALLGVLAMQSPALAAGVGVTVAVLLAARGWLHHAVRHALAESELHDLLTLAAAILVVLPLLPDHALGPYGTLNPRQLWTIVVVIMSIEAAGYIAQKIVGARLGLPLSGLISGFVSSAATVAAMGRRASHVPAQLRPAIAAAVLSTCATVIQLAAVLAVVSPAALAQLGPSLLLAGGTAIAYGGVFTWHAMRTQADVDAVPAGRAVNIFSAAAFAAVVALVQLAAASLEHWFGHAGAAAAAALAGFADTHAPTAGIAGLVAAERITAAHAVVPILLAFTTNTCTKAGFAIATGGRAYGVPVVGGLALVLAAAWAGMFAG